MFLSLRCTHSLSTSRSHTSAYQSGPTLGNQSEIRGRIIIALLSPKRDSDLTKYIRCNRLFGIKAEISQSFFDSVSLNNKRTRLWILFCSRVRRRLDRTIARRLKLELRVKRWNSHLDLHAVYLAFRDIRSEMPRQGNMQHICWPIAWQMTFSNKIYLLCWVIRFYFWVGDKLTVRCADVKMRGDKKCARLDFKL